MLELLLYVSPIVATGVQIFKNNMAKNIIERSGYEITAEDRSVSEVVSSFVKDYFYILVPGYNLYRAFKLFIKEDKEYASQRRSKLDYYERIKPIKKPEVVETPVVKVEPKKEVKKELKSTKTSSQPVKTSSAKDDINELISQISNCDDIGFLYKIKFEYKSKSSLLREEHKSKKAQGASVSELNKIVSRIKIYDRVFVEARDRLEYVKSQEMSKYL